MEDGGDDMWGKMDMIILIVACVVAAVVLGAAIIIPARGPPKGTVLHILSPGALLALGKFWETHDGIDICMTGKLTQ